MQKRLRSVNFVRGPRPLGAVEYGAAGEVANVDTGRSVHGDSMQKDYLRPAGEKIELRGVGWHTFRHTYRTLIDDVGAPLGVGVCDAWEQPLAKQPSTSCRWLPETRSRVVTSLAGFVCYAGLKIGRRNTA